MNFNAKLHDYAILDLHTIEEYLSQYYPSTARNFFDQLFNKIKLLESMPYMYPVYEEDPFFRKMVFLDYLIFYSIDEKLNQLIIHRIIHSKRDINTAMFENKG